LAYFEPSSLIPGTSEASARKRGDVLAAGRFFPA
jgi:hypothetical protein